MFDLIFRRGRILDGGGHPWYRADVGIQGDRITAIGNLEGSTAAQVIDVGDRFLCPGFIDAHIHTDVTLLAHPLDEASLRQGVTTHIIGQDGIGFAPASPGTMAYMRDYFAGINTIPALDWGWSSVSEYLARFDRQAAVNVALLVPHGNLRMEAMGLDSGPANGDQIAHMQALAKEGMEEGAVGFSTGLDYLPCAFGDAAELGEIARVVAPAGGVFVIHLRGNLGGIEKAVEEAISVGRATGIPVHLSHYNGAAKTLLPLVDRARAEGLDVTFDMYCYLAGCTILAMSVLPAWVQEGGPEAAAERLGDRAVRERLRGWLGDPGRRLEYLQLSYVPGHAEEEGLRLADAARRAGLSVSNYICDRLAETKLQVCAIAYHDGLRTEEDMEQMMRHPAHMAGSDGIFSGGRPHPRGFGCFARYLARYTRERGDWTWEQAISHLASHAARRFGLKDRGLIREGMAADVVVFEPERVQDRATFEEGRQYAEGMEHVVVNGQLALTNGVVTGVLAGRALKR